MATRRAKRFEVGQSIKELSVTVVDVKILKDDSPSTDRVTVYHTCCDRRREYTATQISQKLSKARRGLLKHPKCCTYCGMTHKRVAREEEVKRLPAFWAGPVWSAPSIQTEGTYYGDNC
jgi:hypothetical protein